MDTGIAEHSGGPQQMHCRVHSSFDHGPLLAWIYGSRVVNYHQAHNLRRVANDLALLKANAEGGMKNEETFKPLPIAASRTVALWAAHGDGGFSRHRVAGVRAQACPVR